MLRNMKSTQFPLIIGSGRRCGAEFLLGLCFILLFIVACAEGSRAAERTITWAESLVADAESSRDRELPIVVFVTQEGCQFCAALRRQVLYPMINAGELADKAIIREVSLDPEFVLQDFSGNEISGRRFANRYQAFVTPTLLFLDAGGTEVAEKMVGISNIEFYGFYLLKNLQAAREQLKKSP